MMEEMQSSWLVQRLHKPFPSPSPLGDNPFSFGGGFKNGGISDEGMKLIRHIWAFDYMGAAEYEFGAVPEALRMIAVAAGEGALTAFEITVPLKEVPKDWRDKSKTKPAGDGTIYVMCPTDYVEDVTERINRWARVEFANEDPHRLRDVTHLPRALRPNPDEGEKFYNTCGWLELDNGFMFFTDKEMWEKTCALFEVGHE